MQDFQPKNLKFKLAVGEIVRQEREKIQVNRLIHLPMNMNLTAATLAKLNEVYMEFNY